VRRARAVPAVAALLLAACETAVAPERTAAYDFDLFGTGEVFHWSSDRLPVRYWVAPDAGVVRGFVADGIGRWSNQFLYGEFRGILVDDSTRADVLVRVGPATPPDGRPNDDPPAVGACEGVTSNEVDAGQLTGPFRMQITWDVRYADADVVNCLERVTVHEVGHTIGIFGHSQNEFDLMHPTPRVPTPSTRDRSTAEVLYHTSPSITPPDIPR
jgi:predicted Zn-dependent protease